MSITATLDSFLYVRLPLLTVGSGRSVPLRHSRDYKHEKCTYAMSAWFALAVDGVQWNGKTRWHGDGNG